MVGLSCILSNSGESASRRQKEERTVDIKHSPWLVSAVFSLTVVTAPAGDRRKRAYRHIKHSPWLVSAVFSLTVARRPAGDRRKREYSIYKA